MNRNKAEHLRILRNYLRWCSGADGKSDSSIVKYENDISNFSKFLGTKSYKNITISLIEEYKSNLFNSGVSISTYCSRLRNIRKFLSWLSNRRGYKRALTAYKISFMNSTDAQREMAQHPKVRNLQSMNFILQLHDSIPDDNPLGMRDRAAISALITTGIRHKAIISLPLGCVNSDKNYIHQDPLKGCQTKRSKSFKSVICNIDERFNKSIRNWEHYLRSNGFGDLDPFIPRARLVNDKDSYCYCESTEVVPEYWKSHRSLSDLLRKRCQQAGLPYLAPHNFRHILVKHVKELDLSPMERKCFSQSLGHEHERTTWNYGKFNDDEVISAVSKIYFQKKAPSNSVTEADKRNTAHSLAGKRQVILQRNWRN
ncbi:MAG: tyrosine-type recombinase/integrase [Candidatus Cloacimonetes bacterium]|nr:tyrosine-type recombinase/integrase [Candidatus Cloacimonadota bacterium]